MLKEYKLFVALLLLAIFTIAFVMLARDKDIHIVNKEWSCGLDTCDISFDIRNTTAYPYRANVTIRALSGSARFVGREIGLKHLEVTLDSLEVKRIEETIRVKGRPSQINVRLWKTRKDI